MSTLSNCLYLCGQYVEPRIGYLPICPSCQDILDARCDDCTRGICLQLKPHGALAADARRVVSAATAEVA